MFLSDTELCRTDVCWLRARQLGVYVMSIRHRRTREHLHSKIGISTNPASRVKTVTHSQFPHIARLIYFAPRPDADRIEALAHDLMDHASLGREYFACTVDEAIAAVEQAISCC